MAKTNPMRSALWITVTAAVAGLVAAAAQPGQASTAPARPAAFAQCAGCHSTEPGKNLFGPSLAGISKRRAGSLPGYAYSPALKKSGISWNAQTLDRWLTSPAKTVPGTRMPLGGVPDPAARKALVNYLLTL